MVKMPAQYLPKLNRKQVAGLREALEEINEVGAAIGQTNLGAKPIMLTTLERAYHQIEDVLNTVDRRELSFRTRYNLLTPEEKAALAKAAAPASDASESAGEV